MVKSTKITKERELVIYQAKSGAIELRGDFASETVWATQAQIAEVFGIERSVITKHIRNIYKDFELEEKATCAKFAQVRNEGGRQIVRDIEHYNLDMIISVAYRVNSKVATVFRQWATKTLREHITRGYTINRKQIGKNYDVFMKAVNDVQALLPEHVVLNPKMVLELVKEFSATWVSLDAYDKGELKPIGKTKRAVKLSAKELGTAIMSLRDALIKKDEATELFA